MKFYSQKEHGGDTIYLPIPQTSEAVVESEKAAKDEKNKEPAADGSKKIDTSGASATGKRDEPAEMMKLVRELREHQFQLKQIIPMCKPGDPEGLTSVVGLNINAC